jgi:hypothetical protein
MDSGSEKRLSALVVAVNSLDGLGEALVEWLGVGFQEVPNTCLVRRCLPRALLAAK